MALRGSSSLPIKPQTPPLEFAATMSLGRLLGGSSLPDSSVCIPRTEQTVPQRLVGISGGPPKGCWQKGNQVWLAASSLRRLAPPGVSVGQLEATKRAT